MVNAAPVVSSLPGQGEPVAMSAEVLAYDALPFDFDTWMRGEQKRVFLLCLRIMRDRDEADMAAQDSFLKAYRQLFSEENRIPVERTANALCAVNDLSRWITRVAVNTCLDRLRSRTWNLARQHLQLQPRRCQAVLQRLEDTAGGWPGRLVPGSPGNQ